MDRIKLLVLGLLTCLAALASPQTAFDFQWGSSGVGNVLNLRYSPNGQSIVTQGGTTLRLWRASDGALIWTRTITGLVDATFSPDSATVLASTGTEIKIVDSDSGFLHGSSFSTDPLAKGYLAVSPDGTMVATTTDGTSVNLFNYPAGTLASSFASDPGPATPVLQFTNGHIMVGVKAYNLNGTLFSTMRGAAGSSAQPMRMSPDGGGRVPEIEGNAGVFTTLYFMSHLAPNKVLATTDVSGLGGMVRALCGAVDRRQNTLALGGNNGANGQVHLISPSNGGIKLSFNTSTMGDNKSIAFSPTKDEFVLASQIGSTSNYKLEFFKMNSSGTTATLGWSQANLGTSPIAQTIVGAQNALVTGTPSAPIFVTGTRAIVAGQPGVEVFNGKTGGRLFTSNDTLRTGTRLRQMSVSTDGKFLAVVTNASTGNLRAYNLTNGTFVSYSGTVTGAAFLNGTDLVVDGPTTLRVGAASIAAVSGAIWSDRGNVIDPMVSPDGTKAALVNPSTNEVLMYNTTTRAATLNAMAPLPQDYGFLTDNKFWTLNVVNTGSTPTATMTVFNVSAGNVLSQASQKVMSFSVPAGATFENWTAANAPDGRWTAFVASYTDSTGAPVNLLRFWNRVTNKQLELPVVYPGLTKHVVFSADGQRAQLGMKDGSVASVFVPVYINTFTTPTPTIYGGSNATANFTLTEPARPGGTMVRLKGTSFVMTPESVTVAEGLTAGTFGVTTKGVSSTRSEIIQGYIRDAGNTLTFTLNPPALKAVTIDPAIVGGGNDATAKVDIFGLAPAGGTTVALVGNNGNVIVPANVVIPEGMATASVTIGTKVVGAETTGKVTGTLAAVSKNGTFKIRPPFITDFQISTNTVVGGTGLTGTVTISDPAPTNAGVTVAVTSDSGAVTIGTVTVAKGQTTKTFNIDTSAVHMDTMAMLTATSGGASLHQNLTVTAPMVTGWTLNEASVKGGTDFTGSVTISSAAPAGGFMVDVSSSNHTAVGPQTVTIPEGQTTTTYSLDTNAVDPTQSATLTVAGMDKTLQVVQPVVTFNKFVPITIKSGGTATGTLVLDGPAPANFTFTLKVTDNAGYAVVPASITIPAGATSGSFTVTANTVAASHIIKVRPLRTGYSLSARPLTINP